MTLRGLAAVLVFCALASVRGDDESDMPANQEAKVFHEEVAHSVDLRYLLFLPEGYGAETAKRWPLMLFLHGAGERGTNLAKVALHGPPKVVKKRKDFPFILVSPQCPAGKTWSDEEVLALLDQIQQEYRVDTNRVYLTGLSMGGYGTWSVGLKNPERFAAIAPICGGGSILPILLPGPGKEAALKRLPVWAFHGAKDSVVPVSESEKMVELLKKAGNGKVKLTIYPEADHDSWTQAYSDPALYEWLLQQSRERKSERRAADGRDGEAGEGR